jgi:hypothetical protein
MAGNAYIAWRNRVAAMYAFYAKIGNLTLPYTLSLALKASLWNWLYGNLLYFPLGS